jgi:protein SCO1
MRLGVPMVRMMVCLMVFASSRPAAAREDDPHAAHRRMAQAPITAADTRVTLPNVVLRDANGNMFKLQPETFRGKVVVVDFIFTRCTTICPALSTVMASVQRGLGERIGTEVLLVSISVDPANDTPQAMRAYAKRIGAGKHWLWLTGNTGDIARVLDAFGLSAGKPNDHPPLILVGDPARNRWQRWVGIPTPATIADAAKAMVEQSRPAPMPPAAIAKDPHGHH